MIERRREEKREEGGEEVEVQKIKENEGTLRNPGLSTFCFSYSPFIISQPHKY